MNRKDKKINEEFVEYLNKLQKDYTSFVDFAQKENEELKHHIKSHHLDMQKNQQENNQLREIKKYINELETRLNDGIQGGQIMSAFHKREGMRIVLTKIQQILEGKK